MEILAMAKTAHGSLCRDGDLGPRNGSRDAHMDRDRDQAPTRWRRRLWDQMMSTEWTVNEREFIEMSLNAIAAMESVARYYEEKAEAARQAAASLARVVRLVREREALLDAEYGPVVNDHLAEYGRV